MNEIKPTASPRWSATTKLIINLMAIVIAGALLLRFSTIIVPLMMAIVVAYLLQPVAAFIVRKTQISWRLTVNLLYLAFIIILVGLLTWGGVGLVQQIQNLISTIQTTITNLPVFIESLSGRIIHLGPFILNFSKIDWSAIGQQVLGYVQPALGRMGDLVRTLAGSAATTFGRMALILIISYFFLADSGGLRAGILKVEIPGYTEDIHRLGKALSHIWNAFLRGQIIIFFSKVIVYTVLLSILGVHYAIGLALIAGFAGFLPYIGPVINWTALGLVVFFQGSTIFGLSPLAYTAIAIGVAMLIDQVFDNLVAPRIMAQALRVHPAFVLIAAILAANLIGILGIILAAPLLATLQLAGQYTMRKMLDQDPWPETVNAPPSPRRPSVWRRLLTWWRARRMKSR